MGSDGSHPISRTPSGKGERRSVELRAYNCVFVSTVKRAASLAPPRGSSVRPSAGVGNIIIQRRRRAKLDGSRTKGQSSFNGCRLMWTL